MQTADRGDIRVMRILLIFLVIGTLSACSRVPQYKNPVAEHNLPDTHFRDTTSVQNGEYDTLVAFTTRPGFEDKQGPMASVNYDTFLRGYIDKETRTKTFEVHQVIKYTDKKRRNYKSAGYKTARGPKSVGLTLLWSDVECILTSGGGCTYQEHIGFRVSENFLRNIAASYGSKSSRKPSWRLNFVPQSGEEFQAQIMAAEIKGLLDRMNEYEETMM